MPINPQIHAAGALLALALAFPALAQVGNPAAADPGSAESAPGKPAPGELNTQDRLFIQLAAWGKHGEIEAARLALDRSRNPAVRELARRISEDRSSALKRLERLAGGRGVAAPKAVQPDQQTQLDRMSGLSGAAFDDAYLRARMVDHQKTVQLLKWEINHGQDAALKLLAMETLPVALDHLRMVQVLSAELSGAPPQGLAASSSPQTPAH